LNVANARKIILAVDASVACDLFFPRRQRNESNTIVVILAVNLAPSPRLVAFLDEFLTALLASRSIFFLLEAVAVPGRRTVDRWTVGWWSVGERRSRDRWESSEY
jgi:hypothetical protein